MNPLHISRRQTQLRLQTPHLASSQLQRPAIEIGNVLGDTQPLAVTRSGFIQSLAPARDGFEFFFGDPGTVILDDQDQFLVIGYATDPDATFRPFEGVVDQVSGHFLEVLGFAAEPFVFYAIQFNRNAAALVDVLDRKTQVVDDGPDAGAVSDGVLLAINPGAGQVMVNAIGHHVRLLEDELSLRPGERAGLVTNDGEGVLD